jgi:arylsulfatase A-like enzyme
MKSIATILLVLISAAAIAAEPPLRGATHPTSPGPNILWICADDLAAYPLGCYGNKQAQTPNIDAVAKSGVRFDRAYCNSPVCTASRQSFLTGRYPRSLGVTQLNTALPRGTPNLATMLKSAGYSTTSIGKMHFNSDLKHGFDTRIDSQDHTKMLKARKPQPLPEGLAVQPKWQPFKDPARIWLNSDALPFGATDDDMPGTFYAAKAVEHLSAKHNQPFFLMVSFYEPHSPFHFPPEFRSKFDPKTFPVPKVGAEDEWHIPAIFGELTDAEKQGINAAYFTSVSYLDRNIGRVLKALHDSKLDESTIVVVMGDHGYMLGHHGRFEKHCCYEEAIRTPLIFRLPAATNSGTSNEALTELVDIAPTLLELCSVSIPESIQGRSLASVVSGKSKTNRKQVFVEYSENEEAMVRTERWKLIYTTGKRQRGDGYETKKPLQGRMVQLFDILQDPNETTNLAERAEQKKVAEELTATLAEHLTKTAREPNQIPKSDDVHSRLEYLLQPRDLR